jgi:two-component system OmpR family sensor kinase
MVVVIATLAAVGLLAASISGTVLLRSYLVQRVDQQLGIEVRRAQHGVPSDFTYRRAPDIGPRTTTQLYMSDGRLFQGPGSVTTQPDLGGFAALTAHAGTGPYTVDGADGRWRVQVVERTERSGIAVAAASMQEIEQTEATLLLIDLAVTLLVLAGIGVAAARVVGIGLRPLTRMETAAAEIAGGDLSRRVEDADPHTESGRLGTALNTMLVRIETAMADRTASEQRLRQFLADAAHELRTPLTSIQGFAELYRRGGVPAGPDLDEAMGAIESEVGRMRLLVNDLLLLARLDEERPLAQRPVDLLEVAADTVRDAHIRVPARFVLLGPLDDDDDTFDRVTVAGDEARLRQVATNLVANALQHTPDDAEVVVRVGRASGRIQSAAPVSGYRPGGSATDGPSPNDFVLSDSSVNGVSVNGSVLNGASGDGSVLNGASGDGPSERGSDGLDGAGRVGANDATAPELDGRGLDGSAAAAAVRPGGGRSATGDAGRPAAVTGHDLAQDEEVAVLEVSDSGPGMATADAARVFERLYRADPSRSRRHGGAGLGLSIVAAIVQAHGGRCELWTSPGAGARFRVLLPAGPALSEDEADSEVALS